MEEKTIKQLKEELTALGFSTKALEGMKTKGALLATIEALKGEPVESLTPTADPKEEKSTEVSWQTKADRMAKHLEKQTPVRVLVPLDSNEKVGEVKVVRNSRGILEYRYISGAVWSKTFNGYKVTIPKGTYFDVPEQIAKNIAREHDQTQSAGANIRLDRLDPRTGRKVSEQL